MTCKFHGKTRNGVPRFASFLIQVSGFKMPESGDGFPLPAFAGTSFAGMTASLKAKRLAEMTSFPRKRESISVSESRNSSYKFHGKTRNGVPRFASFLRVRKERTPPQWPS